MASVAQIQANRLNAQKSTGPRTPAGKERASRNALKHGLLAREAVIQGENPEEFERYREWMLEDLAPAGAVETMLAERVVGLSWRLRRAERLQNAAFAALDDAEPTPLLDARLEEWKQLKGSEWDRGISGVVDENAALGRPVVADFAEARVLDRLLMYERRIESSLYRTMAQLRREREARQARAAATPEEASRSGGGRPAGQESTTAARLGSFGADPVAEGGSSEAKKTPYGVATSPAMSARLGSFGANPAREGVASVAKTTPCGVATSPASVSGEDLAVDQDHGQDAHATGTPYGVTTSPGSVSGEALHVDQDHGQDAHATERPCGVAPSPGERELCETKPI